MNTRHAVIESPLGHLTLVAEDDALTGVYFRHHWHRPAEDTFGPRVDAESDAVLARVEAQLTDYLAATGATSSADRLRGDDGQRRVWQL
jgi:methylated-DNA-[protein]-cysteine S-methyltransferase